MGAALLRRHMSRSQLVAMSSSEDEGSLRFIYELLGWVEETQVRKKGVRWREGEGLIGGGRELGRLGGREGGMEKGKDV
jgi:hypothetical protein